MFVTKEDLEEKIRRRSKQIRVGMAPIQKKLSNEEM